MWGGCAWKNGQVRGCAWVDVRREDHVREGKDLEKCWGGDGVKQLGEEEGGSLFGLRGAFSGTPCGGRAGVLCEAGKYNVRG